MRKIFTYLFIICTLFSAKAQSTFPYDLDWGTYVGGSNTLLMNNELFYGYSFHEDSQKNIYVGGQTRQETGYSASYYDQFTINGGNSFIPSTYRNNYSVKFSSAGLFQYGSYDGVLQIAGFKNLIGIDGSDNKYYYEYLPGNINNLSTSGVWLTANVFSNNFTLLLSKVDPTGSTIWKTYLPNTHFPQSSTIRMDSKDGNIFVMGTTNQEIPNLGTAGVYQQFYDSYSVNQTNTYLVKLNSAGQKIWATYIPAVLKDTEVSGSNLYILTTHTNNNIAGQTTAGTFQPNVVSKQMLMRFDGANGTRVWGTYFGSPGVNSSASANEIEVNSTGIYISGTSNDLANSGYYATPGAFKMNITGPSDLFLTKFDFTGNRVWGTYFGSNNEDTANGFGNSTLLNNRIVITGRQYANTDNIATPGAFRTSLIQNSPNATNSYFTEFDHLGNMKYCSYFLYKGNSSYVDEYNPEFLSDGSLVIYGSTSNATYVTTPGSAFPTMFDPHPTKPLGYIVKFVLKSTLSASEAQKSVDIVLYDNPNNGNFHLKGNILQTQKASIKITDMSGRLITEQKLEKSKINFIQMKGKLSAGNYMLQVLSEKTEQLKVFKLTVK